LFFAYQNKGGWMSTKSLEQLIGERAYEIYQKREREGRPGSSEGDWHQAVKEVMAETAKKDKAAAKPVEKAATQVAAAPKPAPAPVSAPKAEVKKAAPPVPVTVAKPVTPAAKPVVAAAKPVAAPAKKKAATKKK